MTYIINPNFVFTRKNDNSWIIFNCLKNTETEINSHTYNLLYNFFIPHDLESLKKELSFKFGTSEDEIENIISEFIKFELIIENSLKNSPSFQNLGGVFNSPLIRLDEAIKKKLYDVIFVGFAYEHGISNKGGTKFAPTHIRESSKSVYSQKIIDNKLDINKIYIGERLEEINIKIADLGDIKGDQIYFRNGKEFNFLTNIVKMIFNNNMFPTIMGGDHSISYATIMGAAESFSNVGVIQFDAHSDFSHREYDSWENRMHHGNFMNWILADKRISEVHQIGIRQITNSPAEDSKLFIWPDRSILFKKEEFLKLLSDDIPYFITFDVDVLSPSIISSTGTPVPGGFNHYEIIELFEIISLNCNIVGCDFVELFPGNNNEGIIISDIILKLLHFARKGKV